MVTRICEYRPHAAFRCRTLRNRSEAVAHTCSSLHLHAVGLSSLLIPRSLVRSQPGPLGKRQHKSQFGVPSAVADATPPRSFRLALLGSGKALSMTNRNELPIAFAEAGSAVVNFGILSGREATQAELDRLALALRKAGVGAEMTITAERRQDYAPGFEGVIHQVHVTLADSPPTGLMETICRQWALSCAEDRSAEPLEMP